MQSSLGIPLEAENTVEHKEETRPFRVAGTKTALPVTHFPVQQGSLVLSLVLIWSLSETRMTGIAPGELMRQHSTGPQSPANKVQR